MWLVLAERGDASAAWAADALRRRGLRPLELVSGDELAGALRWEHRLTGGRATFEIRLADGRRLHSESVRGTLNRLVVAPHAAASRMEPADREYATAELFALYTSWLHALPGPVLNPASALGLSGRWRSELEWTVLAGRAGLGMMPPVAKPSTLAVAVVCGRVFGPPLPLEAARACVRLAALAGTPLLGLGLVPGTDRFGFAFATPWPDLTAGGEGLVAALAEALTATGE